MSFAHLSDVVAQAQKKAKEEGTSAKNERTPLVSWRRSMSEDGDDSDTASGRLHSFNSFFHVTESKRLQALSHKGVGQAAFLIRDAVIGQQTENPSDGAYDPYQDTTAASSRLNDVSIFCRRICSNRTFRQFLNITHLVLVLLTFIEPPNWCRYLIRDGEVIQNDELVLEQGRCQEFMYSSGVAAGSTMSGEMVEYYPNTHTMFLTTPQSHILEALCLVTLWLHVWLRVGRDGLSWRRYFRPGCARLVRTMEFCALACLTTGLIYDMCTKMNTARLFAPYMRILIFIPSNRECMREIATLLRMIPEVANVLILLALFMLFYAWIGVAAFYGSEEGKQFFPNLVDAMWSLWIMVTTANYPDVMMPAYNMNRLATIYFLIFMIVTFFFLMNVILGSVVNAYDNELDRRREERTENAETKLSQAYDLLDQNSEGKINQSTVMALFMILNEDFPEFKTIPREEAKLLFAILDKDGNKTIGKREFKEFGNVLLLEFERVRTRKTLVESFFPRFASTPVYKSFRRFIDSTQFEVVIDVILVLNAVVVFIQSYPMLMGQDVELNPSMADGALDTYWELLETIFTCIYVMEIGIKIMVKGWQEFSASNRNLFDLTITLTAVFATIYVYWPNEFSDSRLIRFVVMARVLRLARLLSALAPFQMIFQIAVDVFARAKLVLLLLFCVCYVFAALGVQLFGGMISRDPADPRSFLLLDSEFAENDYWANNFSDMFGAMNVLFNLLVVNNWTECQAGYEAVTQQRYNRLYFVAFHILGVILVNNMVIAFVINAFIKQWDFRQEKLKTNIIKGEAVILGRRALFDAKKITGTETEVEGQFMAKIGRRALFDEQHQQKILKSMFTSGSYTDEKK